MAPGGAEGFVRAPLLAHRLGPAVGTAKAFGKAGIGEDAPENARHVLVAAGEQGDVGHAEAENCSHGLLFVVRCRIVALWPGPSQPGQRPSAFFMKNRRCPGG